MLSFTLPAPTPGQQVSKDRLLPAVRVIKAQEQEDLQVK